MKTSLEIFSYNLRTYLEQKNKTQRQLARALSTTDATVSRWINGEAMPRPAMLDRIAAYLMCGTDDLTRNPAKPIAVLPQDVIADELHENPQLFKLFLVASKATPEQIDACIALLKK